jgi:polysaccharide export outer membrane protein
MATPNTVLVVLAAGLLCGSVSFASAQTPAPAPTPAEAKPSNNTYIIAPGDALQVFVWRHYEMSYAVRVRPDGNISTPLVGDLVAAGKTAPQLARDMEKALSDYNYVTAPRVNIIIANAYNGSSHVNVVGWVQHPSPVPYREGMTVLDAILAAGGLTQVGGNSHARIVRMENGKETIIRVNLAAAVNGGEQNVLLKPSDVVVVPDPNPKE